MLIGLCSLKPQVGKSTSADYLEKNWSFQQTEMSLPVMMMAYYLFDYDLINKPKDEKNRFMLQTLGLAMKQIEPTYWLYLTLHLASTSRYLSFYSKEKITDMEVYRASGIFVGNQTFGTYRPYDYFINSKEHIHYHFNKNNNIVVSGIRSQEEADEIRKLGGKVILIKRGEEQKQSHKVESELEGYENFDNIVENDGSFEDLYKKLKTIVAELAISKALETPEGREALRECMVEPIK